MWDIEPRPLLAVIVLAITAAVGWIAFTHRDGTVIRGSEFGHIRNVKTGLLHEEMKRPFCVDIPPEAPTAARVGWVLGTQGEIYYAWRPGTAPATGCCEEYRRLAGYVESLPRWVEVDGGYGLRVR